MAVPLSPHRRDEDLCSGSPSPYTYLKTNSSLKYLLPPPAYTPAKADTDTDTDSNGVNQYSRQLQSDTASIAERARRFLLYCLATSYELTTEVPQLSKDDWLYFTRVSTLYCYVHRKHYPRAQYPLLDWPRDCHDSDLETAFFKPLSSLGLPEKAAIFMLRLFVRSKRAGSSMG